MERVDEVRKDKKLGICFETSKELKKYVFGDTIDELIDGLELLNDGKFINEFLWKFPDLTETQLVRLDSLRAKISDTKGIVEYAMKRGEKLSNRDEIEKTLLNIRDVGRICEYAKNCQVNNIASFVDLVCEEKNGWAIEKIAKVKGADLFKLKEAIFQPDCCCIDALISFCSYCQQKADDIITQEDIQKVEQLTIDEEDAFYARVCAEEIKGVNISRLQEIVEDSKIADEILSFARYVEGADIDKLRKAMLKTKDISCITIFMKEFGSEPVSKKLRWFSKNKN